MSDVSGNAAAVKTVSHPEPRVSAKRRENDDIDFSFLEVTETHKQKLKRKVIDNPLIPIGKIFSSILYFHVIQDCIVLYLFKFNQSHRYDLL